MRKIQPEDQAFPSTQYFDEKPMGALPGISLRAYMATKILSGLVSNSRFSTEPMLLAELSVSYTDALINRLNKG
jgi:hypothetical protein